MCANPRRAESLVLGDHEYSWLTIPHGIANDMRRYRSPMNPGDELKEIQ
jgi:hypothetical protein